MQLTLRIPMQPLLLVGAVLSAAVGATAATLLPTDLRGHLLEAGRPPQPVHEATSLTQYLIMATLGLIAYLLAITATRHTRSVGGRALAP